MDLDGEEGLGEKWVRVVLVRRPLVNYGDARGGGWIRLALLSNLGWLFGGDQDNNFLSFAILDLMH